MQLLFVMRIFCTIYHYMCEFRIEFHGLFLLEADSISFPWRRKNKYNRIVIIALLNQLVFFLKITSSAIYVLSKPTAEKRQWLHNNARSCWLFAWNSPSFLSRRKVQVDRSESLTRRFVVAPSHIVTVHVFWLSSSQSRVTSWKSYTMSR